MSPADNLNDPFESALRFNDKELFRGFLKRENFSKDFRMHYNCEISQKEINDIINNHDPELCFQQICQGKNIDRDFSLGKDKREEILKSFIETRKKEVRICSFSERNDSILMWSHYADEHKGISIEYDFKDNEEVCKYIEPIYYTDQLFDFTPYFGKPNNIQAIRISAISKVKDWQYEKEWRLIFLLIKENPINGHYKISNPVAIYLGARYNKNTLNNKEILIEIFEFAKNLNIPIYKMGIHKSQYKIVPIQLNDIK